VTGTRPHHPLVVALGCVLALGVTAGCDAEDDTEGGFGLPVRSAAGEVDLATAPVTGVLRVESDGCFTWEQEEQDGGGRAWVVWPDGAEQDGDRVLLVDGTPVRAGQRLSGTGAVVAAEAFADWANPDSYLGAFGRFCDAGERGVVVLDDVVPS
jgi:hypothetical protein